MVEPTFERMRRDFESASAQFVRIELELASTFLDLAATTTSPEHARRYRRDAEVAILTADRAMKNHRRTTENEDDSLRVLRQQLNERLRDFLKIQKTR